MIISRLVGGLGNQLFQWACARNLQKLYGHIILYDDHIEASSRNRDLYRFPKIKLDQNHLYDNKIYQNKSNKIFDNFNYNNFSQIDFSDTSQIYYLDGYWQGEKYFKKIADDVRKELEPTDEFLELNKNILNEDCLSIHIRRTDYVNLQEYHPLQTLEYYKSAVDILNHSGPIYVFSDDIEWCKNNLNFNQMTFINNADPIIDMWTMSICKKNIIANSTFSWWAAWINKNKDKKVVCPKNWFGPRIPHSEKDILDNDWIKL
jgi:hypothetical protein